MQRTNIYSRRQPDSHPTSTTETKAKLPEQQDGNTAVIVTNEKGHHIRPAKKQEAQIKTSLYSHPPREEISAGTAKPLFKINESSAANAPQPTRVETISETAEKPFPLTAASSTPESVSKNQELNTSNDILKFEDPVKPEKQETNGHSETAEADFLGDLVDADSAIGALDSNQNINSEEDIRGGEEDSETNADLIRHLVNADSDIANDDNAHIQDPLGDFVDSEIANGNGLHTKSEQDVSLLNRQEITYEEKSHAEQRRKGFLNRNGTVNILIEKDGEQRYYSRHKFLPKNTLILFFVPEKLKAPNQTRLLMRMPKRICWPD